jgi:hypothetical protein
LDLQGQGIPIRGCVIMIRPPYCPCRQDWRGQLPSWGWSALCPGTNHSLMISTNDNTFGCGYYKRRGGPEELRTFVSCLRVRTAVL